MRNLLENIKKNSQKLLNLTPKDKEKIILKLAQILRENFKIILELIILIFIFYYISTKI